MNQIMKKILFLTGIVSLLTTTRCIFRKADVAGTRGTNIMTQS